tara:strand:+ start:4849 stop:5487 length:639 start_codon:yes stop_codon:yes gene_type:complete
VKYYILNKYLAALSGLFLILFLTGHLAGNLQLLIPIESGAQVQFNDYAYFMQNNPAVKILSYTTYTFIILHILVTLKLTIDSRKNRLVQYKKRNSPSHAISSQYMGVLGTIILAFLIIHLSDFWYKAHFQGETDLYSLVINKFKNVNYVIIYLTAMLAIFLHLLHGFYSSFQSLGLVTSNTRKVIKIIGMLYALVIPILFAIIPLWIYLGCN